MSLVQSACCIEVLRIPLTHDSPSRDGARLLLDPVVDRLLRGEQQDATTIPSSFEDEDEDEWPSDVTPQQALEKLPSANWEALIQCCSANIASEDYETQLAAFQLIDQACSAGDASLASVALLDTVQKPSFLNHGRGVRASKTSRKCRGRVLLVHD